MRPPESDFFPPLGSATGAMRFPDRASAGRLLGEALAAHPGIGDAVVLGLPRGGVPVAYEVARELSAPLDVFVVRKLGVPGHEELAFGAVASGGVRVLDDRIADEAGLGRSRIEDITAREMEEVRRREHDYRGTDAGMELDGRTVILVDDGLATGSTMRAAVQGVRARGAERIVVAVPTGSPEVCDSLRLIADDVICLSTPEPFQAVGMWYDDFSPTTDEEVRDVLARAGTRSSARPSGAGSR